MSLLKIQDVVMKCIMKKLDFESIQNLRKVCRTFRNFIDENKIDNNLAGIIVGFYQTKIKLILRTEVKYLDFWYQKEENGCLVVKEKRMDPPDKVHLEKNADFVDVFLREFKILMDHQKSVLEEIYVGFHEQFGSELTADAQRMSNGIESTLKSRKQFLRVERMYLLMISQENVMKILPHLDPAFLERIDLNHSQEYPKRLFAIDKLIVLEQWKRAMGLGIWRCLISESIQNLTHFIKAEFVQNQCSMEMLSNLKENLSKSNWFNMFRIYFENYQTDDEKMIFTIFGQPYEDKDQWRLPRKRCFSRITGSDQVISLKMVNLGRVNGVWIYRLPIAFVPKKVSKKQLLK
ncbi:hypothetical protein L5515_009034 [Caenorhabditis briggsae]|uniref:F-box domain-containing protein n=1 Tax=Caenorhabditis briggsae TaxID=6238 RepID=A0AAE9JPI7_CAEBR|nr:hypothetical protein L5515_009034 [Caenorhabditis briggsae]